MVEMELGAGYCKEGEQNEVCSRTQHSLTGVDLDEKDWENWLHIFKWTELIKISLLPAVVISQQFDC